MVRAFLWLVAAALCQFVIVDRMATCAEEAAQQQEQPAAYEVSKSVPAETAAVEKLLDKAINVNLDSMTLTGLVDFLDEHGIGAYLDIKALEEAGMGADTTIRSLTLRDISIRSVLNLVLWPLDMRYVISHGKLRITTSDVAGVELNARIYNVADLVRHTNPDGTSKDNYDSLVEVITTAVKPDSWDEVGGPGSIGPFQGTLVISQTDSSHAEIVRLLAALRECRASQLAGAKLQPIWGDGPQMLKMRRQFAEKSQAVGDYSFNELPLDEAIDQIAQRSGIQMALDLRSLEEAGMGADTPVTAELRQVTLPVALEMLLEPFDLTYCLSDEVVSITTTDAASQMLTLSVYPVADLVQFGVLKVGGAKQDFDSLIEVATQTILPDTWDVVGGPASIKPFSGASALVVVQRPAAHEELASLLAGLRQLRAAQPPAEEAAKNTPAGDEPVNVAYDDEFVSRTYRLNTSQDPQFVIGQIQALGPGQWYGEGVEIRTAGSKLYLRNTRAAQQRALWRLRQMQALVSGPGARQISTAAGAVEGTAQPTPATAP